MSEPKNDPEAIFHHAIDLPTTQERAAYLAGACGEDKALRQRVEALICAHEASSEILPNDPQASPLTIPDRPLAEKPGTVIGRYKLLQQIGEGGFGVVYMAEQQKPIVRKVALKIIKLGMDTREVIGRFEAERQALALMDHPHIAKVLDAGATDTGRPYFVMDLVKGVSITQFCSEQNLSLKDRLKLLIPICSAVQHAHDQGIIHRDLKPSNILVTWHGDEPVPKVIDFGIAKATQQRLTEKTLFTRFAHFIGTPAYMSPEQAAMSGLEVDGRTDVYSLGVLVYELLTQTTPFDTSELMAAGYDEIRRTIQEVDPEKPSTRVQSQLTSHSATKGDAAKKEDQLLSKSTTRFLRGDLDWIVMKALEKDRRRRYESPQSLADDIGNFLTHRPVLAAAPGPIHRSRKFVRRHPIATVLTVTLLIVVSLFGTYSSWQAKRLARVEKDATEAKARAEKARAAQEELQSSLDVKSLRTSLEVVMAGTGDWPPAAGLPSPDGRWLVYPEFSLTGTPLKLRNLKTRKISTFKDTSLLKGQYQIGLTGQGVGAWSPDSKFVVHPWYKNRDGEILITGLDGSSRVLVPTIPNEFTFPVDWSPDGQRILLTISDDDHSSQLAIVDPTSGRLTRLEVEGVAPRFSPDNQHVVYASIGENSNIHLLDLTTRETRQITQHPKKDQAPFFSPQGTHVIFNSDRRNTWDLWSVKLTDEATLEEPNLLRPNVGKCFQYRAPKGRIYLATSLSLSELHSVTLPESTTSTTLQSKRVNQLDYGTRKAIGWSPDGKTLAYFDNCYSPDQTLHLRQLPDYSLRELELPRNLRDAFWTQDGKQLVAIRNNLIVLDPTTNQFTTVNTNLMETFKVDNMLAFSPNGWWPGTDKLLFRVQGKPQSEHIFAKGPVRYESLDIHTGASESVPIPYSLRGDDHYLPSSTGDYCHVTNGGKRLDIVTGNANTISTLLKLPDEGGLRIQFPAWSPDGQWIAYGISNDEQTQRSLHVRSRDNQRHFEVKHGKQILDSCNGFICSWHPNSREFIFTLNESIQELALLSNLETVVNGQIASGEQP